MLMTKARAVDARALFGSIDDDAAFARDLQLAANGARLPAGAGAQAPL